MRDAAAEALGVEPGAVAVGETGVIGVPLDDRGRRSAASREAAGRAQRAGGADFARAIMTTDRGPEARAPCAPAASPSPPRRRARG